MRRSLTAGFSLTLFFSFFRLGLQSTDVASVIRFRQVHCRPSGIARRFGGIIAVANVIELAAHNDAHIQPSVTGDGHLEVVVVRIRDGRVQRRIIRRNSNRRPTCVEVVDAIDSRVRHGDVETTGVSGITCHIKDRAGR